MEGEELSVFALTDGINFASMLPAQDHKRLLEKDQGPNTGGMGAYAPVSIATDEVMQEVSKRIIAPAISAMRKHDSSFSGLLYAGLMLTADGPKVVEFNCRFGDPETQVVLPLLRSSLFEVLFACSQEGGLFGAPKLEFLHRSAVTTVVAAPGYPDTPRTGAAVTLPDAPDGVVIFHAGTKRAPDGGLVTSGGRVVAVTGTGESLEEAQRLSLETASRVEFPERFYRRDIGWRELARRAGTA
jgi:phosphoribosylamine--glycine ligase